MAKAKTKTRKTVVLKLTRKEAEFLRALVGYCVVGSGSAREANEHIYDALQLAGVWLLDVGVLNTRVNVTDWKL